MGQQIKGIMSKLKIDKNRAARGNRANMQRREVMINKLGDAIVGIRVFWIIWLMLIGGTGLLLGLAEEFAGISLLFLGSCVFQFFLCEMVLIKNLKLYKEWARISSILFLIAWTILCFCFISWITAGLIFMSSIPGILALKDSRTKKVFADRRREIEDKEKNSQSEESAIEE